MLSRICGLCAVGALLSMHAFASTIPIEFYLTHIGTGNTYRYDYTVTNDGSLGANVPIKLFDIFFDPALYAENSLAIVTSGPLAAQWSEMILGSVGTSQPAFDVYALGAGIPVGATATGFAVQFSWLGQGLPGPQPFSISDPNTFEPIGGGTTTPEPYAFWGVGLLLLWGARRVRSKPL